MEIRNAIERAIAESDLSDVWVVEIEGEPHRVTGSWAYVVRKARQARADGRRVGTVERLDDHA
jgi:hypothetical protein